MTSSSEANPEHGATSAIPLGEALLPHTLRNAARIPFYEHFWRGIEFDSADPLGGLPVLDRLTYADQYMHKVDPMLVDFVSHTSGTSGSLAFRHRGASEAGVLAELFKSSAPERLGMMIDGGPHGMLLPVPSPVTYVPVACNWRSQIDTMLLLLNSTIQLRGEARQFEVVAGASQDVVLVAQVLQQEGIRTPSVQSVVVTGFADEVQLSTIREAFGADLVSRYSMSEVLGGASGRANEYELDPVVLGEVLSDGERVCVGGCGELVLTELFPFVQHQPLVRYGTRDLVRVTSADPLRFEWLGRAGNVCISGEAAFGTSALLNFAAHEPLIARSHLRSHLSGLENLEMGLPVATVFAGDSTHLRIDVELVRDLTMYGQAVQQMLERLWSCVTTALTGATSEIDVEVCLTKPPGPAHRVRGTAPGGLAPLVRR